MNELTDGPADESDEAREAREAAELARRDAELEAMRARDYIPVSEIPASQIVPLDGGSDFERSMRDRSWAPPGGTSDDRFRYLNAELGRAVLHSIRERVPLFPGLRTHRFTGHDSETLTMDNHPILYWAANRKTCYAFYVTMEHRLDMPEQLQRVKVKLWFEYSTGGRENLIDTWLTDDNDGIDPAVYADMILGAVLRHGHRSGFGTGRTVEGVGFTWTVQAAQCTVCGEPARYRTSGGSDADTLCDEHAAAHAANGYDIHRITPGG